MQEITNWSVASEIKNKKTSVVSESEIGTTLYFVAGLVSVVCANTYEHSINFGVLRHCQMLPFIQKVQPVWLFVERL